ncbi:MCE family protein [Nocardia sp. 2]|uniref:MCE family protein n=1 Tax=Nocardia acididurans TaxID=2802282 RepID=A0ABS1MG04_9NOCA|nr:MCE family protein [Nocardia acididurans]
MSNRALVVRVVAFTAVIVGLLSAIVLVIQRPISGATSTFEAMFTDASGLRTNADVRMFGVAVGKVTAIDLDGTRARVRFTVVRDRPVYQTSTLAIRYQNLAGQRYIDVKQPDTAGPRRDSGSLFDTDHTTGSFDITALFNGMAPVLKEFSPDALNQFTRNAIAVIEGDGSAVSPTLEAIGTLSQYASDRQALISVLLRNFEQVSQQIGGKSPEAATLIKGISDIFVNLQKQFDGLMDFVGVAPPILGALNNLLAAIGLTHPDNPDLQADLRLAFPDPDAAIDLLNKIPGLVQSLIAVIPSGPAAGQIDMTCRNGVAEVPTALAVLIAGQRISVCNG